jgi:hypothetical protein
MDLGSREAVAAENRLRHGRPPFETSVSCILPAPESRPPQGPAPGPDRRRGKVHTAAGNFHSLAPWSLAVARTQRAFSSLASTSARKRRRTGPPEGRAKTVQQAGEEHAARPPRDTSAVSGAVTGALQCSRSASLMSANGRPKWPAGLGEGAFGNRLPLRGHLSQDAFHVRGGKKT